VNQAFALWLREDCSLKIVNCFCICCAKHDREILHICCAHLCELLIISAFWEGDDDDDDVESIQ
jgi:hypothetical protein